MIPLIYDSYGLSINGSMLINIVISFLYWSTSDSSLNANDNKSLISSSSISWSVANLGVPESGSLTASSLLSSSYNNAWSRSFIGKFAVSLLITKAASSVLSFYRANYSEFLRDILFSILINFDSSF